MDKTPGLCPVPENPLTLRAKILNVEIENGGGKRCPVSHPGVRREAQEQDLIEEYPLSL